MPAAKKKPGKRRSSRSRLPAGLRKARVDSVLKNLPDEAQEQLWTLRNTRHTTGEAVLALATKLAGRKISKDQLYDWLPWYQAKTQHARVLAQITALDLLPSPTEEQTDRLREHGTTFFMTVGIEKEDPEVFDRAGRLQLAGREMRAKEESLRLAVEKFEEQKQKVAEKTKRLRKGGNRLSDAERSHILDEVDEILGIRKAN